MITTLNSYNRLWACLRPVLPVYLGWRSWRGKEDKTRHGERLARAWQADRPEGVLIWLHAVSVGEAVAAVSLARACLDQHPSAHVLITTNTVTALDRLAHIQPARCLSCYQPLDDAACVDRFLGFWQPDAAVFLESDFWPNLVIQTAKAGIPVTFASSQLSDTAYENWQRRPVLAGELFGAARLICAVDDHQRKRFEQLCQASSKPLPEIRTIGSLKLNAAGLPVDKAYVKAIMTAADNRAVVLAASTHEPEEKLVSAVSADLAAQGHPHLLIIAPRHLDRAETIASHMPTARRRSQGAVPHKEDHIFLADSFGELGSLITAADVVILGGSFAPKGGHNPLEIAAFGKPVVTGPSQFKNQAEFDKLHQIGQCITAQHQDDLKVQLASWLVQRDKKGRLLDQAVSEQAKAYVTKACERPAKTAQLILDMLR